MRYAPAATVLGGGPTIIAGGPVAQQFAYLPQQQLAYVPQQLAYARQPLTYAAQVAANPYLLGLAQQQVIGGGPSLASAYQSQLAYAPDPQLAQQMYASQLYASQAYASQLAASQIAAQQALAYGGGNAAQQMYLRNPMYAASSGCAPQQQPVMSCCGSGFDQSGLDPRSAQRRRMQAQYDPALRPPPPVMIDQSTGEVVDARTGEPTGLVVDPTTGDLVPAQRTTGKGSSKGKGSHSGEDTPPPPAPRNSTSADRSDAGRDAQPATHLESWPRQQKRLHDLGVDDKNIARIGAAALTDEQLDVAVTSIEKSLAEQKPKSAWNDGWAKKFHDLGLSQAVIDQAHAECDKRGLDDKQIDAAYKRAAATTPGWNADYQKKFEALGMPAEIIKQYADSKAPAAGIDAAYEHAKSQFEAFKGTDRYRKLTEQHISDEALWSEFVLASTPIDDKKFEERLNALKRGETDTGPTAWIGRVKNFVTLAPGGNTSRGGMLVQHLISFAPGGELGQYIAGRKAMTGESIDRTDITNIAKAALSAAFLFTAIRGGRNITASWAKIHAIQGGTGALSGAKLGVFENATMATKVKSVLPGFAEHRALIGWGNAEAGASAFVRPGANGLTGKQVLEAAGRGDEASVIERVLGGIYSGELQPQGPKNAYLPKLMRMPFKAGDVPVTVAGNAVQFSRSFNTARDGSTILASLADAGAQKIVATGGEFMGANSGWAQHFSELSPAEINRLGTDMFGRSAAALDVGAGRNAVAGLVGRVYPGPVDAAISASKMVTADPSWVEKLRAPMAQAAAHAGPVVEATAPVVEATVPAVHAAASAGEAVANQPAAAAAASTAVHFTDEVRAALQQAGVTPQQVERLEGMKLTDSQVGDVLAHATSHPEGAGVAIEQMLTEANAVAPWSYADRLEFEALGLGIDKVEQIVASGLTNAQRFALHSMLKSSPSPITDEALDVALKTVVAG